MTGDVTSASWPPGADSADHGLTRQAGIKGIGWAFWPVSSPRRGSRRDPSQGRPCKLRFVSDRDELLKAIRERAVIHGPVTLSSGQHADWYVDLRRILLDGSAAPLAGRVMLATTAGLSYDAVGGLTLGADPVATAMMHAAAAQGRQAGRVRRPEGGEGPRPAAPDRGTGRRRPPGARRRGHLDHRRVGPDRGGCPAGGRRERRRRRGPRRAGRARAHHRARPGLLRGLRALRPRRELTRVTAAAGGRPRPAARPARWPGAVRPG